MLFCWFSCQEKRRLNSDVGKGPDLSPVELSGNLSGTSLKIIFRLLISDIIRIG